MHNFTPLSAALGGLMIGLSAVLMMGLLGRITGISGILKSALFEPAGNAWRWAFLAGILGGAAITFWLTPARFVPREDFPLAATLVAGLLVGLGTAWSSGCTSGHGVCGLARLSQRSGVATMTFMGYAFFTFWLTRSVLEWLP